MALKDFLKGIQYAIDLFEPIVERHMQLLDEEHRKPKADPVMLNATRVSFRAFGEVVGGLKLRRDEFAGRKEPHRLATHQRYLALRQQAEEERDNPLTLEESKATETRADACMVVFALSPDGKFPDGTDDDKAETAPLSNLVH